MPSFNNLGASVRESQTSPAKKLFIVQIILLIIKNYQYLSIYVNIFKEWEADPVRDC